jgi:hypothetical protein
MPPAYPFLPKSNRSLRPGQFWSIPLACGRFACGRVLAVPPAAEKNRREFYAGLLDWAGDAPPTFASIAGRRIIEQGLAHIKTFTAHNVPIRGCRPLALDQVELPLTVAQACWQPGAVVMQGYEVVRYSQPEDHPEQYVSGPSGITRIERPGALPVRSTWGHSVLYALAERHFGPA